ncbi:MAG TPA: T9SS type A sorting domain-containing protein [Ignavibacteriaceae bacterium]|nr:T9SS type A sorting domain-containing protein [Ignavibacteriaceae bacterium]
MAQSQPPPPLQGEEPDITLIPYQSPTYKNFPTPEEVLVVYAQNSIGDSSQLVADYYRAKRNIPNVNVFFIDIPQSIVYPEGTAELQPGGEDIWGNGNLGWRYVKDAIADPIENYLNTTLVNGQPLKNRINYIVLCKGMPLKVRSTPYNETSLTRRQASVSALLCLINQPEPSKHFLQYYNTIYTSSNSGFALNPYYSIDPSVTMNYRFKSNHFVNENGWYTQYLVSRLDGEFYTSVFGMIDRQFNPDYSGEKLWAIDETDPLLSYHNFDFVYSQLNLYGYNILYDNTASWLTTSTEDVIAYVSNGVYNNGMPWNYILDILLFNYANGSTFISWESLNSWSYGVSWFWQGQVSHFIYKNGSNGSGNVYEPFTTGITREYYTFPRYALGYSVVDAHFMGIYLNAWQNCVVGDPLSAIAWGKQILTKPTTWQGKNLVTDTIFIPTGNSLTINANSIINVKRYGFITGEITNFIVNDPVIFNISNWSRALFVANHNNHPKLLWGNHPTIPPLNGFKVYRKIGTGPWSFLAAVFGNVYHDYNVEITPPQGGVGQDIFYRITAVIDLNNESVPSNEVYVMASKIKRKESTGSDSQISLSYSLKQNHPNPFNPSTKISYSILEDGLVQLKVYDILGNEIAELVNINQEAGNYTLDFNAGNLPSGIYFYKLTSGSFIETKKLILLK